MWGIVQAATPSFSCWKVIYVLLKKNSVKCSKHKIFNFQFFLYIYICCKPKLNEFLLVFVLIYSFCRFYYLEHLTCYSAERFSVQYRKCNGWSEKETFAPCLWLQQIDLKIFRFILHPPPSLPKKKKKKIGSWKPRFHWILQHV